MVLNQNAKESEGEIMNYVSCNVVNYKRVRVLQWTQFKNHLKERAYIKINSKQVLALKMKKGSKDLLNTYLWLNHLFWNVV